MSLKELITALHRLKVETGSIACLGCGHEHNCGIHGCAIIREAAEKLGDFNAVFDEDTVVRLAARCLKVDPNRLRELAEADKDGHVVVSPCKVDDVLYRASPSGVVVHRVANGQLRELTVTITLSEYRELVASSVLQHNYIDQIDALKEGMDYLCQLILEAKPDLVPYVIAAGKTGVPISAIEALLRFAKDGDADA